MEAEYIAFTYDGESESGYRYSHGNRTCGYGATPNCYSAEKGQPQELYRLSGAAAQKQAWTSEFHRMNTDQQRLIAAVFPDVMTRDNLKPPKTIYEIAVAKIHKAGLTRVCPRCGGTGNFSYNQIDGTRCFKCGGRKYTLPRITNNFLAEVKRTLQ